MRNDLSALQDIQRFAFSVLQKGGDQFKPVSPWDISIPSMLRQEQAFTTAENNYQFDFGSRAPDPTVILNNTVLGDNDVFAAYGIQIFLGRGADANNREYQAVGPAADDDSLYNGNLSWQFENSQPVEDLQMTQFRSEETFHQYIAFEFINPIRVVTGRLGTYEIQLFLPRLTGLVLTDDLFISVRLHGALGRAGQANR